MRECNNTAGFDVSRAFGFFTYRMGELEIPYRFYVPAAVNKSDSVNAPRPLVIFLHGSGSRGNDNTAPLENVLAKAFLDPENPIFASYVLAPQCGSGRQWVNTPWAKGNYSVDATPESPELAAVIELTKKLCRENNIDRGRIYLTGVSMGGFGVWDMLARHGELFAYAMPVCGGGDPSYARKMKDIPICTFHGSADESVPVSGTREMVEAVKAAGGKITYTELKDAPHAIWDGVFSDTSNFIRMFAQTPKP